MAKRSFFSGLFKKPEDSTVKQAGPPAPSSTRQLTGSSSFLFHSIKDKFTTLEQVQQQLRAAGLESSNLIIGVDFTKSNEWNGSRSFGGRSLHDMGSSIGNLAPYMGRQLNPYEEAIQTIGKTLEAFDDDKLIPCYGFGDATTHDTNVFSFFPDDGPARGWEELLTRYRELAPLVKLAGPTSFGPLISQAIRLVITSGMSYHILLIIADGQVTQEGPTIRAIVEASKVPLSIIMVGVGDGPWDTMQQFDDALPQRAFDNFQFVNFTQLSQQTEQLPATKREALFALRALMEIPDQYKAITKLRLMDSKPPIPLSSLPLPLPPPTGFMEPDPRRGGLGRATAAPPQGGAPRLRPSFTVTGSFASHRVPFMDTQQLLLGRATSETIQHSPFNPNLSFANSLDMNPSHPPGGAPNLPANKGQPATAPTADTRSGGGLSDPADSIYHCPITMELMEDPVLCADGYTYERDVIERWLEVHDTSPMSNEKLEHKLLTPVHQLRSAIMEYKAKHK